MSHFFNPPLYLIKQGNDDFAGIMTRDELDNLQEDICDIIQYPTTIIDNRLDESTGQKLRADSGRSSFVYCSACSVFRICDKAKQCLDSDNIHANILFNFADDIVKGNADLVNEKIRNYLKNSNENKYYDDESDFPQYIQKQAYYEKFKSNVPIRYLIYMCPIMGLTELIFPIIVENQIVSVLFVGQLYIKDKTKRIQQCRDDLLSSQHHMFEKYFQAYDVSAKEKEFIFNVIKRVDDDNHINLFNIPGDEKIKKQTIGHQRQTFDNSIELEEYIYNTIFPEIWSAQDKISAMLKKRRDEHVSKIVNNSISSLQEKIEELNLKNSSTNILDLFWNNVSENLKELMSKLGISGFEIYTYDEKFLSEKTFNLICNANKFPIDETFQTYFAIDKTELKLLKDEETRGLIVKNKLNLSPDNYSLVIYHELLTQKCIALIHLENSHKETNIQELLKKHLLTFLVNIMHEHAIVLNIVEAEKTKKTLRIYRHEISHLNLGLTGIYYNFESPSKIHELSDEKIIDIHNDFKSSIDIMNYMTSEIGLFTGAITSTENIFIEEFKIYKELIWKWETLYRNELKRDSKRIKTVRGKDNWEESLGQLPLIKSDRKLLEVIIYNIVNNAIKYSFFGTNIHIDCDLIKNSSKQLFTVKDYGNSIATNTLPYQLYFRDENIKDYTTDGNGIGLYVSKVAANLLGINIRHTCRQVCKYNVPFIQSWIDFYNNANYPGILDAQCSIDINDIKKEKERLINEKLYHSIVNESFQTKVEIEQVIDEIMNPTYEVVFEVEI